MKGRSNMENTIFRGQWMCAAEFAALEPKNVFHPEITDIKVPKDPVELQNYHMLVKKTLTLTEEEKGYLSTVSIQVSKEGEILFALSAARQREVSGDG